MPSPIEVILVPTLMILLGYLLKRLGVLKQSDRQLLSNIVLMITLPSMIFINLSKASISSDMLLLPVLGLVLSLLLLTVAYLYCKKRGYSKRTTWTIVIAASMMNTGFMGFPISLGAFGNVGFINAVFYDISTTTIFILYGVLLTRIFGGDRREVLKSALTFIPLWAVLFALVFNVCNLELPYVVDSVLNYFADATVPLIMFALGISLDFKAIGANLSDSLVVSSLKLIVSPFLMNVLLVLVGIHGMSYNVAILEAAMSTAMNALVLSIRYDLDSSLMSSLIFTNVILSLPILTLSITLLT